MAGFYRTSGGRKNLVLNGHSYFSHKITDPDAQSFGDSSQRLNRNLIFSALNVADVISRQIRPFRKFFLAQTSFEPLGADGFAENSGYFAASRHNIIAKQEYELQIYQAYLVRSLFFSFDINSCIHNPSACWEWL